MGFFQCTPGRRIPPCGHGKRQEMPSSRDAEVAVAFVQTRHQLPRSGFTNSRDSVGAEQGRTSPYSPSPSIRVLGRGGGREGCLGSMPRASAVAHRNRRGSHRQREAGTAELMCGWCPSWLPCGAWHAPRQIPAAWESTVLHLSSTLRLLRIHRQGMEAQSQSDNHCPEHINVM